MAPTPETCGALLRPLRDLISLKQLAVLHSTQHHDPISRAAATVLAEVRHRGECRVAELAAHRTVDASVVSRQIAQLDHAGLIGRRPEPADRRVSLLRVTGAGEELLRQLDRRQAEWLSRALNGWDDEAVRHLVELVSSVTADIRKAGTGGPDRGAPGVDADRIDEPSTAPALSIEEGQG
jgi:DNA-binding MarR family transcriptional regulator